jgi:hypothetical protein
MDLRQKSDWQMTSQQQKERPENNGIISSKY